MIYIAIFLGGAIGGGVRYLISLIVVNHSLPFATFTVNILGALLMGICSTYLLHFLKQKPNIQKFLTTGFLGALTTYSSLSLEVIQLIENSQFIIAILYVTSTFIFGLLFIALGFKKGSITL